MNEIGQLIRQKMKEKHIPVVWLARQLGFSRTNIYKIFEHKSVNTADLLRISELLGHDFFEAYSRAFKKQAGMR